MLKRLVPRQIAILLLCFILAISSFAFGSAASSSTWGMNQKTIQSLDEKKTTVMELTAAATAASVVISLIPGDAGSSIADKLADFSGYFLIVLTAIYLEKYLLTITGFVAFKILIPLALLMLMLYVVSYKQTFRNLFIRLLLFALAIFLVVPSSEGASHLISNTYQASIQQTLDAAKETTESIEENVEKDEAELSPSDETKEQNESSSGVLDSISGFFGRGVEAVQDGAAALAEGASGLVNSASVLREKASNVLNQFIESLAIMLVTTCLIPIAVIFFFGWLLKMIFQINLNLPDRLSHASHSTGRMLRSRKGTPRISSFKSQRNR